jgi:acyl-[acyl carrier protein]--UDP-N-acetylglucosamine O-acyltransferase
VTIAETAVVYPGTHLGAGVAVGDYAVLGKSQGRRR